MSARLTVPDFEALHWFCAKCGAWSNNSTALCQSPGCNGRRAVPCQPASAPPIAAPDESIPARRGDRAGKGHPGDSHHYGSTEKNLQAACENWLTIRGYLRLTADNAAREPLRGWFGHLPRAKGQPFMPDLFIFAAQMRKILCVELKRVGMAVKYQPGQREMIMAQRWTECRTLDELIDVVQKWEKTL